MRFELIAIVAQNGRIVGAVAIVGAAFLCALLYTRAPDFALMIWGAAIGVASLVRISAGLAWQRGRGSRSGSDAQPTPRRIAPDYLRRWELVIGGVGLLNGFAWASLVLLVDPGVERIVFLVTLGLSVVLVFGYSSYAASRLGYGSFAVPIAVAEEFNLLQSHVGFNNLLVIAWPLLAIGLFALHRLFFTSLVDSLAARIDHERMAFEQNVLVDTAPLGIIVVRDGLIVVCNDASLKLFGYRDKKDLLGRSIRLLIPDKAAWREALDDGREAMRGPVRSRIVRRKRADGAVIDVKRDIAAVTASHGETEFIGIYEDINERLAIEEGFRHAVQLQRLVFEAAGEGIAIVTNGVIEQANQALSDLLGVPVAKLKNRSFQSMFQDPEGWAEIEKQFERLGNALKLERRVMHSGGNAIWVCVTGRRVETPASSTPQSEPTDARSIWIFADLSKHKEREAETWHQANHDVLTGLPNRRFLQDRLDQALALARRDGRRVAVLELDLDGFKEVNDQYGHRFGDAVLEEIARRLPGVIRELDTAGRWGGDEFVLVLKEIDSRDVVEEMVRRVIARVTEPIAYGGEQLSVGVSVGIALFPDNGEDVEALILAADLAMYEAKAGGGNTWRFSSLTAQAPHGKYRPALAPET
ncbi:MAG: diguanylate cyclase domain-containing protein [Burkholderiaceae bacterium]